MLDLQNSTIHRDSMGFTEEHFGGGLNSTIVRSWSAPNQVTTSVGGGILFHRVTFDASGSALSGTPLVVGGFAGGKIDIGSAVSRVQGPGLSLDQVTGKLTIPTLNIFNNAGTGLNIGATGTDFSFTTNGGTINTLGSPGIRAVNINHASISNLTVSGGVGWDAVVVDQNEPGLISDIVAVNNTWTASGGNADGVSIFTSRTSSLCLDAHGNKATGSGTGFGVVLAQTGSSVLGITQSDLAAFAADNPATLSLDTLGTISFDCVLAPLLAAPIDTSAMVTLSREDSLVEGTNDSARLAIPENSAELTGTGGASGTQTMHSGLLSDAALAFIVDAAIRRWTETGLAPDQVRALRKMDFKIAGMPGWYLGATDHSTVRLDVDGAGAGWFIDPTPLDDSEFTGGAVSGFDLLTTVMHEMGHVLGLPDIYSTTASGDAMFGFLSPGERRLPRHGQAEDAIVGTIGSTVFFGSPINIGTLPAGKSVTITFQATVKTPFPSGLTSVSNQGTVSGSNFASVVTDDPKTIAAGDPTVTDIDTSAPGGSSIHGRKWNDVNGDGTRQPDEPWLNGWTIELTDLSGRVIQSSVTMDVDLDRSGTIEPESESGWYWLTDVPAGSYLIREQVQPGWRQTAPFDGRAFDVWLLDLTRNFRMTASDFFDWGGLGEKWFLGSDGWYYVTPDGDLFQWDDSPRYALSGNFVKALGSKYYVAPGLIYDAQLPADSQITVGQNEIINDLNFGNEELGDPSGSIHGQKFDDRNGNGRRDAGEPYLNGWTIELRDYRGNVVASTMTMDMDLDHNGSIDPETERGVFWFDGLPPNTYIVGEQLQAGWTQTAPYRTPEMLAWQLDQQEHFQQTPSDWLNWGGLGEKWFYSTTGWRYITPDGSLYTWNGSPPSNLSGDFVATFDPSYHADLSLLYAARFPANSRVPVASGERVEGIAIGNHRPSTVPCSNGAGEGNVRVRTMGRDLIIEGDKYGNGLSIYLNEDGRVTVGGHGHTTINGSEDPFVTNWTRIPGSLKMWLWQGDDAVCIVGVPIASKLWADFYTGNDCLLARNMVVSGPVDVYSLWGNSYFGFQDSRFESTTLSLTGSGNDTLYTDNVWFGGHLSINTGLGNDFVVTRDSHFGGPVTVLMCVGQDKLAVLGTNHFENSVWADGGPNSDSRHVDPLTTFRRKPRDYRF